MDILAILGLVQLSRRFRFGWKTPRVYLATLLLIAAIASGFLFDLTVPVHDSLEQNQSRLPQPMRGLYRTTPPEQGGFTHGILLAFDAATDTLTIVDERTGDITEAIIVDDTHATTAGLEIGSSIIIAGDEIDGVMHVFGIRKADQPSYKPNAKPVEKQDMVTE